MPKGVLPPGLRAYQFQKKSGGAAAPSMPKQAAPTAKPAAKVPAKSAAKAPAKKGTPVKAHSRSTRKSPVKAYTRGAPKAKAAMLPKGLGSLPGDSFLPAGMNTPNAQLAMGAPPFSGVGGVPAMPMGRGLGRQMPFIPNALQ